MRQRSSKGIPLDIMQPKSTLLALIAALAILSSSSFSSAGQTVLPAVPAGQTTIVRVYYPDLATGNKVLISFEPQLLETNYEGGYHVMEVTQEDIDRLAAAGLRVEKDVAWVAPEAAAALPPDDGKIPRFDCYRTVEKTYDDAATLAASHPTLASWLDVGDSWEKAVVVPDLTGYDMMVLKLTNSAVPGPKPKLFVTAAIHAREYATAELVTQFGEYLVNHYGVDADATWILDHHEIDLMLQANPDGRKQAEGGYPWRKNTNQGYCGATSSDRGADLNRNFSFQWNCCGGSSSYVCDELYRGPSAGSELETRAVQNTMDALFPDQRGPDLTDAALVDATGIYIDVHSYGELVLWPWGFTADPAPNAAGLQTLGRKFAYFNSYTPQQAIGLYPLDGSSDDHAYGTLGVAAYTFEIGTSFFQQCDEFEKTLLPANLPALIYAAKVVRTPYLTPAGPDVTSIAVSNDEAPAGAPVTLDATLNDTLYSKANGTEPIQNIAAAEYYVDIPPWQTGAVAFAMTAADGSLNSMVESVTATLDTGELSDGRHTLFVRGQDAGGNWGAFSAIFLTVTASAETPTYTPTPTSTLTATPTATSTPTASATPTATPTAPREDETVYLPLVLR
jgi:carboxypeptidase T